MYKLIALNIDNELLESVWYTCQPTRLQVTRFRMRVLRAFNQALTVKSIKVNRVNRAQYSEVV